MDNDELDLKTENAKTDETENIDDILTYYNFASDTAESDTAESETDEGTSSAPQKAAASATAKDAVEKGAPVKAAVSDSRQETTDVPEGKKISLKLYALSAAAVLLIALIGFLLGRFILPVSDEVAEKRLSEVRDASKEYNLAKSDNATLTAGIDSLEESNENIEKVFDSVIEYQKEYDNLQEEKGKKQAELDALNSDYEQLKSGYDKLQSKMSELKGQTVTLTPGMYTVGENIPEGNYSATGNGSLLIADSGNTLKINTILDDVEFLCSLNNGDIIKLETQAEFVPEGE